MGPIILISTFAILLTIIPMSNLLDTCLVGCICNDTELYVRCEKSKLDVIPITFNPYVTNLILNNNNIKSIESSSFEFYDDLKRLDLSTNMISSLPNNSFKKQKNLTELYLNRNKIAKIDPLALSGLRNLSTLSLRNNLIDKIGEFTFKELTNLITLNLGENRISEINAKAFYNLKNLSVLYLDDNLLSSISNLPMGNLKNLAELYIGRNNFKTLQKDSFFGLSHLLRLDLSGSAIFHLNDGVFNDLASLRILNLIDNKLDSIPTSQLSNLSRLEELYLGQNNFRIIQKDAFKGLDSLRRLEITGSIYLERIESEAFSTNLNLETLILKDNRALKVIEDGILIGFPKLKHVEFHNNALESLSESVMSWSDIKYLDLSNNPLLCDCNLLWLSRHLVGRNMSSVQCSLPFSLKDLPLKSLSANDLGCSFTDPHQQMFFAVMFFFAIVFLAGVGVYLYRYRQSVREALKEHKWNKRALNRKEHEYQKTFSSDDDYILRTAIQHQNHLHSQSQTLSVHHPHHLHHHSHHNYHLQNHNHSQQYLNHTLSYSNSNQTPNQNQYYSPYHHQQLLHNQSKSVSVPISNATLSPHAKPIPVTEL